MLSFSIIINAIFLLIWKHLLGKSLEVAEYTLGPSKETLTLHLQMTEYHYHHHQRYVPSQHAGVVHSAVKLV